jgi:dynein heavy chain
MSSSDCYWTKVESAGRCPEPRSHHTAVVFSSTKILFFGGFRSSSIRYNDVWILDTANDEWSQPHAGVTETRADGEVFFKRSWVDVPVQRGGHSATVIGNQMFVFGGYGGSGFARRDFNDISALDLETWEWRNVECTGELPEARSGHQGVSVQENLYVIGGWNR